jgi:hypothetical protein
MSPEHLAEQYYQLAERAWSRVQARRAVDWQTGIALWTAFGTGAAACLTSRVWFPGQAEAWVCTGFGFAVVMVYLLVWLPWQRRETFRDMATSYFWESKLQQLLGEHNFPKYLRPETEHDFPSAYDVNGMYKEGDPTKAVRKLPSGFAFHRAQIMQLLVTIVFVSLFVGSVWSKWWRHADRTDSLRLTIGNSHVDVPGQAREIKVSVDGKEVTVTRNPMP